MNSKLLDIIVCPKCLGNIEANITKLNCRTCGMQYNVENGIMNLLLPDDIEKIKIDEINRQNGEIEKDNYEYLERQYKNVLIKEIRCLNISNRSIVLDAGCGTGFITKFLFDTYIDVECIAMDISYDNLLCMFKSTKNKFKKMPVLLQADWDNIPIKSNAIDYIIVFNSLHHSVSLNTTMKSFFRILKSNGIFISVKEPMASVFRRQFLQQRYIEIGKRTGGIETMPSYENYRDAVQSAGFSIVSIKTCEINYEKFVVIGKYNMNGGIHDYKKLGLDNLIKKKRIYFEIRRIVFKIFNKLLGQNMCKKIMFCCQRYITPLYGITIIAKK